MPHHLLPLLILCPSGLDLGLLYMHPCPESKSVCFRFVRHIISFMLRKASFSWPTGKDPTEMKPGIWQLSCILIWFPLRLENKYFLPQADFYQLESKAAPGSQLHQIHCYVFLQTVVPWSRMHISNKYSGSITFSPQKEN